MARIRKRRRKIASFEAFKKAIPNLHWELYARTPWKMLLSMRRDTKDRLKDLNKYIAIRRRVDRASKSYIH